jgi:hypothetical protein
VGEVFFMTSDEEVRLRELPSLIDKENDFEKVRALVVELERLLSLQLADMHFRPGK